MDITGAVVEITVATVATLLATVLAAFLVARALPRLPKWAYLFNPGVVSLLQSPPTCNCIEYDSLFLMHSHSCNHLFIHQFEWYARSKRSSNHFTLSIHTTNFSYDFEPKNSSVDWNTIEDNRSSSVVDWETILHCLAYVPWKCHSSISFPLNCNRCIHREFQSKYSQNKDKI